MSARYSKTSSRGRSMVIESSMGSTAPAVLPAGGHAAHPDGPLVLGRAHELGRLWRLAAARAAELADDPLAVEVDPLAHQRRAVAVTQRARASASAPTLLRSSA